MRHVLVTGAHGFLGKNLCLRLSEIEGLELLRFGRGDSDEALEEQLGRAEFVFHLAGVNRSDNVQDFFLTNAGLIEKMVSIMECSGRCLPVVFASSTHAGDDNPYGQSKRTGEDELHAYRERTGARVYIYRLGNLFGKWSRPNYNSVIATFCYNIAHGLKIDISDPSKEIQFEYVDSVVQSFCDTMHDMPENDGSPIYIDERYTISLGELAGLIASFRDGRQSKFLPDFSKRFVKYLYSTYLSYLDEQDFSYPVEMKSDQRGELFELMKSEGLGQIFISSTKPGAMRGNHYHHTKVEKFCVIKGTGLIRLRSALGGEIIDYHVSGEQMRVVDIPPGYTHSIENIGQDELITLFWACEPFDAQHPDTVFMEV